MRIRPVLAAALIASAIGFSAVRAQERIEIFDAHLHYNQEPTPFYTLDQVREVFRRNGIIGIVANSRPNKGTHELSQAKWPELKVVPFIRPYRVRSDIQTWFNDPAIFELIKSEYARGGYLGIGEFHIYGKAADSDWVKKIVDFSVERNLYLHAHCDEEALLILFRHNPKAVLSGRIPVFRYRPRASRSCSMNTKMRCGASCPIEAALPAATAS
jgi:hypothetical protein